MSIMRVAAPTACMPEGAAMQIIVKRYQDSACMRSYACWLISI